jgi:ribosomal protein S18 acetylase RimI-like enzyme
MHLVDRMSLSKPYTARPYRGQTDHRALTAVLAAYRRHIGDPEMPTVEQVDVAYAHLTDCDPEADIALIETVDGEVIAYCRASWTDLESGGRDCVAFSPILPDHLAEPLYRQLVEAQERHMRPWVDDVATARFRAYAAHPGPGETPTAEAAWLEAMGYEAIEWGASLVRPHLDDIPERDLPDGVEVRPAHADQVRQIWEAHWEAFRGEWDFREPEPEDIEAMIADPHNDPSLWKIAWVGDQVVGQVKSFINHEENAERGYLRGYTEYISTHEDWRNKGIASALLAMSLQELKDRGMTEAALGVDTNNPGGAFHVYTALGFELQSYEAVYTKSISR